MKDLWYIQVENHFYKMKGGVGMSRHEQEREQEDAYTKTEKNAYRAALTCSNLPIPTSLL